MGMHMFVSAFVFFLHAVQKRVSGDEAQHAADVFF